MYRKQFAVLFRREPENPQIPEAFLVDLRRGLLLALKEEGYLREHQLRQALEEMRAGGKL